MTQDQPFVTYLEGLRDDRAALAALRRGLGQPPGTVPDMYRYIVPWLPADAPRWREEAYYLIAALFGYHADAGGTGNVGHHFARTRAPQGDNTAIERRFTTLLAAHPDDLHFYLRQAVSYLKSKEVPINWHQLCSSTCCAGVSPADAYRRNGRAPSGAAPHNQIDHLRRSSHVYRTAHDSEL